LDAKNQEIVKEFPTVQVLQSGRVISLRLGTAGVQVMDGGLVVAATSLMVAANLNAVPPGGIEGMGMKHDGSSLDSFGMSTSLHRA